MRISKVKTARKRRITQEDITVFTRQLATMMKAGLPLMQAFEIVARGHSNPSMTEMLMQVRSDVEQGSALGKSFSKYPKYFDRFYCNLVSAGGVRRRIGKPIGTNWLFIKKKPKPLRKRLKPR